MSPASGECATCFHERIDIHATPEQRVAARYAAGPGGGIGLAQMYRQIEMAVGHRRAVEWIGVAHASGVELELHTGHTRIALIACNGCVGHNIVEPGDHAVGDRAEIEPSGAEAASDREHLGGVETRRSCPCADPGLQRCGCRMTMPLSIRAAMVSVDMETVSSESTVAVGSDAFDDVPK